MPLKGLFNQLKKEVEKEITKQLGGGGSGGNGDGSSGGGFKVDLNMIQGVLNLIGGNSNEGGSGGGSSQNGIQTILKAIQKVGGILPGDTANKLLPGIMKVAEMFGRGLGDDTPRTEQNPDGTFVDNFIKTIVDGRKIHAGSSTSVVKELQGVS